MQHISQGRTETEALRQVVLFSRKRLISSGAVHKVRHAIFGQFRPPLSHFVTHPGTPKSTSHISDPPSIFSRPSTKIPEKSLLYKFYLNCSRRFLSGLVFVRSPFCHNTSVTTES